jgi:hypothetical protein
VIVVVGLPAWSPEPEAGPAGRACTVALAAAASGTRAELVGRAGDDPAGDALVLALAAGGVGHAALLRDPARATPIVAPQVPDADDSAADAPASSPPERAAIAAAPAPHLEPADVGLGLRYLGAFNVLVVTDDVPSEVLPVAVEAAGFVGAQLVLLLPPGATAPGEVPDDALVLEAPADDDGAFSGVIGAYAAAVDGGTAPAAAFATAVATVGWEVVEPLS